MPSLDLTAFNSLTGSKDKNFENLCRGLMRLHFERSGHFKALSNQPGVEFHLELTTPCSLGDPPRWYGWQCKFHKRTLRGNLTASSKIDIEESLRTTERVLPGITDWVLWAPYTLSKSDQDWFYSLSTSATLHLWSEEELDTYLSGDGLILRSTYFGELILSPDELSRRHQEAIQSIRERWLEPVHQQVEVERTIRRMLGEPGSWKEMIVVGERLRKATDILSDNQDAPSTRIEKMISPFITACSAFADTLLRFHEILADGDLDIIQQKLQERKSLINREVHAIPMRLRIRNLPIALDAANALDDMRIAQKLLDEVEEFLGVGLVAVLADAGGGKTQMAAELTKPQNNRPAGILFYGRDLRRGETLDDLAHHFLINGTPLSSMESLLAALDAAGKRSRCRLPLVIDGLNEAENPKDWKASLASLNVTLKRYPNVLVVCTLRTGEHRRNHRIRRRQFQTDTRESFAQMALPDGLRMLESEGFGRDVHNAIKVYFNHYKINSGDAEIPVDFLRHPLTLRIFCEVTNRKRESVVNVDYFPATLSPLFEKYVANACERISSMTNLSYSYTIDDLEIAVYQLGLELWKAKRSEVSETDYKVALSDTAFQWDKWDSNIVNLFAQEGIIFRNSGDEPGQFVIRPVYDALGGYIVAHALLEKHKNDMTFEWFKQQEVIESFGGDESHQLASDIFRSLVTLVPRRMYGKQLWKMVPNNFRNVAIRFTTLLDLQYLDEETVGAFSALLKDNPRERTHQFARLQGIRGARNHPLNSEYLDSVLRDMPISDRDLSWTEWVRETRQDSFNDLLAVERKWKENLSKRTKSDQLRAKWIMWLLTSTDHELRYVATRALYWFGRGDSAALFEETLNSLQINDPYVPERMLAASYGVAMAQHVDVKDSNFVNTTLPGYARRLYDSMFGKGAPCTTTHSLIREYATRTIELTALHNPGLFSQEELERSKPPFTDGGLRNWGESEASKEKLFGLDTPFRMDFENYTIGRLVPGRRNYNYKNEGYRKVRSQILWRVKQLGWSKELFKDVDRLIENKQYRYRTSNDWSKIDRYGKKYSWIAYFEMSGFLNDQGALENWRERISSVDIDPSFPEPVTKDNPIKTDFLGDPDVDTKEWIVNGVLSNIEPYLRFKEVQHIEGPWVALDGFVVQEDEARERNLFCHIRSFLVRNQVVDSFLHHLCNKRPDGLWPPEKPNVIYTFAGEIPWCKTFPKNGLSEFSFDVEEVHRDYAKFEVLIPVCDFGWEGEQSATSGAGHAKTLAKEIALDLKLIGQPQTFDLFTTDGIRATFNISDHSNDFNNHQSMFFIRENLLKTYLEKNDLSLIWIIGGERRYSSDRIQNFLRGGDHTEQSLADFSLVKRYE